MLKPSPPSNIASLVTNDPRWKLVEARDVKADGQFYYSVKTTGVYCKPSCGARLARPENIDFHLTTAAAEAAGYRPCKRCKPDQAPLAEQYTAKVAQICRLIEQSDRTLKLQTLAAHADMSVYHFHRMFKAVTGLTPKAYEAAHKARSLRGNLEQNISVTEAIYEAGYGSNSRFYESSTDILGMTPSKYRKNGAGTDIKFAIGECSLGSILVASSDKGICAISIGNDPNDLLNELQDRFSQSNLIGGDEAFELLIAQVVGFIESPALGLDLPLDLRGTVFQQRVWQALREIPPGTTATYTQIAVKIGMPKAVRAVAKACGANTLAVAIPCHRVIRNDGSLSGYRWGVERKRKLLDIEIGTEISNEDA